MVFGESDDIATRAGLSRLTFPYIFEPSRLDAFSGG